ncbi:MAG: VanZ family protein [Bacteroidia bacterium]|nr:VanZ family protein [Bacteroidia bacterium]
MFLRYNLPAIIWALIIFVLCSMPGKSIPNFDWMQLFSFDKLIHAGIFFVLQLLAMRGFFLQNTFPPLQAHFKIIPLFICICYGGELEILQSTVFTDRAGELLDFIANSVGALLAALLFEKLKWLLGIKNKKAFP